MINSYYDFFILINDKFKDSSASANCAAFLYEVSNDLSESFGTTYSQICKKTGKLEKGKISIHNDFLSVLAGKDKNSDPDSIIIQVFNDLLANDYQLPDNPDHITAQIMTIGFFYSVFVDEKTNTNLLMLLNHRAMMLCQAIGKIVSESHSFADGQIRGINALQSKTPIIEEKEDVILSEYDGIKDVEYKSQRNQVKIIIDKINQKIAQNKLSLTETPSRTSVTDILNKNNKKFGVSKP